MKMLSAKQAADILGVHHSRVRVLIREGRLPAQKVGRDWIILQSDLELVKDRKPGRPAKKEKERSMDREIIAKKLNKIEDAIQSMEQEDEKIKQLETTDPDKAKKMIAAQLDKLIELHEKQMALYDKFKKEKND